MKLRERRGRIKPPNTPNLLGFWGSGYNNLLLLGTAALSGVTYHEGSAGAGGALNRDHAQHCVFSFTTAQTSTSSVL